MNIETMNEQAMIALKRSNLRVMRDHMSLSKILLNLKPVMLESGTCATDMIHFFYNPEYVLSRTEDELDFVVTHEVGHDYFEHPLRIGSWNLKLFNIAADLSINSFLVYECGLTMPKGGLLLPEYRGWAVEAICRDLDNNPEKLKEIVEELTKDDDGEEETMWTRSEDGEDGSEGEESEETCNNCGTEIDNGGNWGRCDPCADEEDSDSDSGSEGEGDGKENQTDKYSDLPELAGGVVAPRHDDGTKLDSNEMEELRGEFQRAKTLAEKLEATLPAGSDTGNWTTAAADNPKHQGEINWKELMKDKLMDSLSDDTTWSRPNRRFAWSGTYLPSRLKSPNGGEVAVMVDTSGSVSQRELDVFSAELQILLEECGIERVRICYCDTSVKKNSDGEWWDVFDLDQEDLKMVRRGGGGTSFTPPFNLFNDWSEGEVDDVVAIIYFTDGEGEVDEDVEPDVPVIWAVTSESCWSEELPFGEIVYIDPIDLRW